MSKISVLLIIFVVYNIAINIGLVVIYMRLKKNTREYRTLFEDYKNLLKAVKDDKDDKYDIYKNADGLYTNIKGVTQNAKFGRIKRE
jgi:hypothetical protein